MTQHHTGWWDFFCPVWNALRVEEGMLKLDPAGKHTTQMPP